MCHTAKLTVGKWNYVLATLHTLHGALDAGLFLLLATSGYLLRHESISAWASALGRSTTQVQIGSSLGLTLIGLLIAVGVAIDSVRRWVQARRAAQFAPRPRPSQPS